jgi:two-component sensor histidine kinase
MREADHRIRNSLQLVSTVLRLQAARYASIPLLREELADAIRRIDAVARVHERLQRSELVGEIDLVDYLRGLCADFAAFLPAQALDLDAGGTVLLPADTVISLGLITNELVTNACKHTGREGGPARIRVALSGSDSGILRLSVEGHGNRPMQGSGPEQGGGLGIELVNGLAHTLGGRLEVERRASGSSFAVLLPRPVPGRGEAV